MIDRALLARIRKCLALSASSNEHEAAAALAKARDLMREHGISDADLAMAEIEEASARASGNARPPLWETYLVACVKRALNVHAIIDEAGDRRFIGRGPSAEIAAYAFTALRRRLKAARGDYISRQLRRCTPTRKRVRADAYCEAWAVAVHEKVAALAPAGVADPAIGQWLARQYPGLATITARSAADGKARIDSDRERGWSAGSQVDLHHGMTGAAPIQVIGRG